MIRLFSTGELPLMDIIEMQGRIVLPDDKVAEAQAAHSRKQQQQQEESRRNRGPRQEPSVSGKEGESSLEEAADNGSTGSDVTLPLGTIRTDHLNPKRCTLRIGTLHVGGSRGVYKMPILVMRCCPDERVAELLAMRTAFKDFPIGTSSQEVDREQQCRDAMNEGRAGGAGRAKLAPAEGQQREREGEAEDREEEPTMLLSEWLDKHPQYLSLDALYTPHLAPATLPEGTARSPQGAASSVSVEEATTSVGEGEAGPRPSTRKRGRDADGGEEEDADDAARQDRDETRRIVEPSYLRGMGIQNYELVGLVEDYVCFNMKPARVFE